MVRRVAGFGLLWLLLAGGPAYAQLRRLLGSAPDTVGLARVLVRPAYYRLQISLVRIRRDAQGRPHASRPVRYHVRPRQYFYPASSIKLAAAVLALEKFDSLRATVPALQLSSPMRTDSAFLGQTRAWRDASAANDQASLGHYLHKMLLVSDNDAYNRLYEFVGPRDLNRDLHRLGLHRARLVQRLAVGDKPPGSRHTNPIRFFADTAGQQLLYAQPAAYWAGAYPATHVRPATIWVGSAYLGRRDSLIHQPLDLSQSNLLALRDLQRLLQAVVLPQTVPAQHRPALDSASRRQLLLALSQLPPQSRSPHYDSLHYPGTYAKFLLGAVG